MRKYEGMIIIDPKLEEEKIKEKIEDVKKIIEKKGKIEKIDEWGKRQLAYPINKREEGYYLVIEFEADGSVIQDLRKHMDIGTDYLRYMFIRR
ncbi:MAG TPA: 30S ribosomal protein S6 [candidate division WOR-3 bacterium]|uniref:Small ribosomal subunit protein bS6 n=1 Tax=candidate division WOR-3 bacterium TaxID=2052148 RepID=A0A7C0V9I7_UNCW3|nr:30S ribosomal protein S6 [candidate division WOR-3 bacterium]